MIQPEEAMTSFTNSSDALWSRYKKTESGWTRHMILFISSILNTLKCKLQNPYYLEDVGVKVSFILG